MAEQLSRTPGLLDSSLPLLGLLLNVNPFFLARDVRRVYCPDLKAVIDGYHEMGYYVITHRRQHHAHPRPDGGLRAGCAAPAGPGQGGVDLAEVKRLYGDRICLIGNVNCGLLQTGTDEACATLRCGAPLRQGMEGWGYVFATSNCVYTGLPLSAKERMNRIWWEEGIHPAR